MTLTDPHRSTVREKLRPVIADDSALDALMSQFPASDSDRPVTEAVFHTEMGQLRAELTELENRLSSRFHDSQMRLLGILLAFTTAYMAIVIAAVAALR